MKITNEFAVTVPIERAWAVLTDLEGLAPCLPGAQLTDVDGDVYQGRVRVKVGPVVSEFAGTARFVEKDDAAYRGVIDAKGRDARSAGTASALVTAHLRPDGDRTLVSVDTDLKISGRLAQFGSGMIKEVSGKLLAQFVANLEAKLAAEPPAPHPNAEPVTAPSAAPPEPTPAASESTPAASAALPEPTPTASATAVATTPSTAAVAPSPVEPSPVAPSAAGPSVVRPSGDAVRVAPTAEPEALDLLSIAGGSVTKRLVPVLVGLVAVGAVIAWLVARR
ncbi:SRPBCC family protein [Micromonospora saelicesensis]|uniref:Carbon monoxide dehydrogenase subunit G n=1 Tax=Micromonospora saelicesensis TaxID=285676 RepID=A0A1C4WCQ8_9ACTN|nr:SRPBCC family protein [Micromonospora saelicesensis]SCE94026.1 Carbon monoxide dehydrogenase subunit G [Micromonospora saelicesensis]